VLFKGFAKVLFFPILNIVIWLKLNGISNGWFNDFPFVGRHYQVLIDVIISFRFLSSFLNFLTTTFIDQKELIQHHKKDAG